MSSVELIVQKGPFVLSPIIQNKLNVNYGLSRIFIYFKSTTLLFN